MTGQTVIDATDASFAEDVVTRSGELPVVVDFWAPWCGPCHALSPVLERVAGEFAGRVQLVKVDIDENPEVATRFNVRSIPMVIGFRDGGAAAEFVGAQPEPAVRSFFEGLLPSEVDRIAEQGGRALSENDLDTAADRFRAALAIDPHHRPSTIALAATLLEQGDFDGAAALAERFPADTHARRVLARVAFVRAAAGADRATVEARIAEHPSDAEAHYRLGALDAVASQWEPALEHFLETAMLDRAIDDDGARLRMLEIFHLLGDQHPLTSEYRRRLTNVLF
jgi:putative thioredoxin